MISCEEGRKEVFYLSLLPGAGVAPHSVPDVSQPREALSFECSLVDQSTAGIVICMA